METVLLVPGLFGFGTFGNARQRKPISYFDRVIDVIERVAKIPRSHILVHEPPPTGSLESRAATLFEKMLAVLGDQLLQGDTDSRLHLVGHSTGGIDVRLVTNTSFCWPGLDEKLREKVLERVGTVVTVSAPLYGTPIARKLRRGFKLLLDALSLWTVLDDDPARSRKGKALPVALLAVAGLLSRRMSVNGPALGLAAGVDEETARQIARFRNKILADSSLIHDLSPEGMREVNRHLDGHDHANMKHVVTVAPRPRRLAFDDLARRTIYRMCYEATADDRFMPADNPNPAWFASHTSAVELCPRANDGVVPSSSQFLRNASGAPINPVYVVLADHLDVVGHFDGKQNTTAFKSEADFDEGEHELVWSMIAQLLGTPAAAGLPAANIATLLTGIGGGTRAVSMN